MSTLAFISNMRPMEILVILVVALLVFGKRLPEVGRSLGKGIVEFKKGLKGVEDDVDSNEYRPRREDRAQFEEKRDRGPAMDDRRVGRSDTVDAPPPGSSPQA